MSYCVNCGVELADSEKNCPLCHTPVINPAKSGVNLSDTPAPYPPFRKIQPQKVSRGSIVALLTILFLLPLSITVICNYSLNRAITWSGYVIAALAMLYVFIIPPIALRKLSSVGAMLLDALALSGFLYFVERATGGAWLIDFALPVVMLIFISVTVPLALSKYTDISGLIISAILCFMLAADILLLEVLLTYCFMPGKELFIWSQYPAIVFVIAGMILLYINANKPLRERLARKFFI